MHEPDATALALARVARARGLVSAADAVGVYAEWAEHYDRDVFGVLGVTGSRRIADLLAEHARDAKMPVVDLGCGTGVVGAHLRDHGFTTIDGVDISPEMLAVARSRECYRSVSVADLTDPTALSVLPTGLYGASVSAGTLTTGHVGVESVPRLLRFHAPGAVVAWVIGAPLWPAFEEALAAAGVTTLHAGLEPIRPDGPPESMMFVGRIQS